MSEQILMDGEPLEIGDPVYSRRFGAGKVVAFKKDWYPIRVEYTTHRTESCSIDFRIESYSIDFKVNIADTSRDLYWQKPEIVPPPKPKKKVKVWDWFVQRLDGRITRENTMVEQLFNEPAVLIKQKIDGTEREIEV